MMKAILLMDLQSTTADVWRSRTEKNGMRNYMRNDIFHSRQLNIEERKAEEREAKNQNIFTLILFVFTIAMIVCFFLIEKA